MVGQVQQIDPKNLVGNKVCDERYKVLTHLGSGSMGHVFRGYDNRLEADIVIKVPTLGRLQDEAFRKRFTQEAALLVRLTHPHIVKIMDLGDHEGIPLLVMQYLSGGTLRDRMTGPDGRPYKMKFSTLGTWLPQIAKALDFVHEQGSVHRDVKPGNILFDEHGNAFLADFGLTKILASEEENLSTETGAGFVVGTPNYIAPEVVLGRDYDGQADQYSLALTVYEALVAKAPMHAKSGSAAMVNQTRLRPTPLAELGLNVPERVSKAVAKAMAKKAERRFETCSEFADAVMSNLESKPAKRRKQPGGSTSTMGRADTSFDEPRGKLPPRRNSKKSTVGKLPGRKRSGKGGSGLVGKKSKGKPGAVDCPKCDTMLPIPMEHAGKTGRCVHCNVRVKIGPKASTLEVVRERGASGSSASADDLIIGEKVFGVEIPKKLALGLAVGMILFLVCAAMGFTWWLNQEEEDPGYTKRERTQAIPQKVAPANSPEAVPPSDNQ